MTIGTMEVTLVGAKRLKNTEFLGGGIDPYVLVQYKSQEHKSGVAQGQGSTPVWNEKFTFRVEYPGADDHYKLILKIMDKDTFTADDYLGQATIYLKEFWKLEWRMELLNYLLASIALSTVTKVTAERFKLASPSTKRYKKNVMKKNMVDGSKVIFPTSSITSFVNL